ncbi:MAG: hypothetical protein ABI947_27250 [Chloroflexota bacterium]
MDAFLSFRKSYIDSPIARAELLYLRRIDKGRNRWLRWVNRLPIVVAVFANLVPVWLPLLPSIRTDICAVLMIVATYTVQLNVALRTLTLASHTIARETQSDSWDSLVLTGLDARQIVLSKWWTVLRCVWKDHLAAALLKIGLVYGLLQYFTFVTPVSCYSHLGGVLCDRQNYGYTQIYPYYSPAIALITVILILVVFGLAEAGLLAALGICTCMYAKKQRIIGLAWAVVTRGILALAVIAFWVVLAMQLQSMAVRLRYNANATAVWQLKPFERMHIIESAQVTLFPLADGGTTIVTNLVRWNSDVNHVVERFINIGVVLGLYGLLTRICLRMAQRFAEHHRALHPPS